MTDKGHQRVAIVAGVGPGLGAALVRKLVAEAVASECSGVRLTS
jgi:NAD(P)-dependent dehydrogenase (short-subunit alcohol dehydrogenase family)